MVVWINETYFCHVENILKRIKRKRLEIDYNVSKYSRTKSIEGFLKSTLDTWRLFYHFIAYPLQSWKQWTPRSSLLMIFVTSSMKMLKTVFSSKINVITSYDMNLYWSLSRWLLLLIITIDRIALLLYHFYSVYSTTLGSTKNETKTTSHTHINVHVGKYKMLKTKQHVK